jgi:flagellin
LKKIFFGKEAGNKIKGFTMRLNGYSLALRAIANSQRSSRGIAKSVEQLSSGLRINRASDDPAGMFIADGLRSNYSALGAAARNANEVSGIIKVADKAIDEQVRIADLIRAKAVQASHDGNSLDARRALQEEVAGLVRSFDFIAESTEYNGKSLLLGGFANQRFQVGASANQTVSVSFGSVTSTTVGHARFATSSGVITSPNAAVDFTMRDTEGKAVNISGVSIGSTAGTGIGAVANKINAWSHVIGAKAHWNVESVATAAVAAVAGVFGGATINGEAIGPVSGVTAGDGDGRLVASINAKSGITGVIGFTDISGRLHLKSLDGRGIVASTNLGMVNSSNYGYLTLSRSSGEAFNFSDADELNLNAANETSVSLGTMLNSWSLTTKKAMGIVAPGASQADADKIGSGLLSIAGANAVATIAQATSHQVDVKRSRIGAVGAQLEGIVSSLLEQQVNIKAAESNIRDVDFAEASSEYARLNILSQAGSFAVAQANKLDERVLKFLQY